MRPPEIDLLRRCQGMHAAARQTWGRRFLGRRNQLSAAAAGTEVTGHSDYVTGDDIRYVDWHRAARLDELVSKQFRGSELGRLDLLMDTSASMGVGEPAKIDLARQLTAALGYFALAEAWSVRLASFGGGEPAALGTFHGLPQAPALLRAVDGLTGPAGAGQFVNGARTLLRGGRGGVVIVLGDLLSPDGYERGLDLLRRAGCELYVVQTLAAEDVDPQRSGAVRLTDLETGRRLSAELDDVDLENYRAVFGNFRDALRRYCGRRGIALWQFRSDWGVEACLERLIATTAVMSAAAV